jgi:hypothetical protein
MRLTPALALLLAGFPLAFTACGDDDDGGDQPPAFEVEVKDELGQTTVTAPETAEPGAIEIRFTNSDQRSHSLDIVHIGEGHTAAEIKEAGEAWGDKGRALPDWITFSGGIGSTKPGGSGIAVVELPEGEYAAFDTEGKGDTPYAEFTVEGDEGEALPEVAATIEAVDYDFNASALGPGSQRVLFENTGVEPHHVVGAPLRPGKTIDDVKEFIETEKGEPPIDESKSFNTAILSGGQSAVVDLRLEAGDYALLCFVTDRAGGQPHVVKGMAAVATVE